VFIIDDIKELTLYLPFLLRFWCDGEKKGCFNISATVGLCSGSSSNIEQTSCRLEEVHYCEHHSNDRGRAV